MNEPPRVSRFSLPWLFTLVALLVTASQTRAREWTDSTGRYTVEAELVEVTDDKVLLKKTDGRIVSVPLARLSAADRDYVNSLVEQGPNGPEAAEKAINQKLTLSYEKPFGVFAPHSVEPLFGTLELTGKAVEQATAYGFVRVKTAKDDTGQVLRLIKSQFSFDDPTKGFVEFDSFGKENDTATIHLMFERPSTTATHLAVVEGSVRLMTGGRREEVVVDNVLQKSGSTLSAPPLKAAGMRLRAQEPGEGDVEDPAKAISIVVNGPTDILHEIALVDSGGEKLNLGQTSFSFGRTTHYTLESQEKLPADTKLKLTLVSGQQPMTVPFKFVNVAIGADADATHENKTTIDSSKSGEPLSRGLRMTYYDDMHFRNKVRNDVLTKPLNHLWRDAPAPGLPPDGWSCRYEGYLLIKEAGEYEFHITSDDGSRLYIDGKQVIDNWGNHGPQRRSGKLELRAGWHRLRIDHYDHQYGAHMRFLWTDPKAGRAVPVPLQMLRYNPSERELHTTSEE